MCRERFADRPEARFVVNDGKSLGCVPDRSIDFVWSFDVFVHMERETIAAYLAELRRVMRVGATAVLHYPSVDRATLPDRYQGWRGDVRSRDMLEMLAHERFELLHDYYEEWISATNTSVAVFRQVHAEGADRDGE